MKKAASSFAALSLVTLALATSCNQTPTRPSAGLPPQPPEAPLTRVEIQGPASIRTGRNGAVLGDRAQERWDDGRCHEPRGLAKLQARGSIHHFAGEGHRTGPR